MAQIAIVAIDTQYREHMHTSMPMLFCWSLLVLVLVFLTDFWPPSESCYIKLITLHLKLFQFLRWCDEILATSASIFSHLIRYLSHLSSIRYKGCGRRSTTFNSWVFWQQMVAKSPVAKCLGCLSLVKMPWEHGEKVWDILLVVHTAKTCGLLWILSLMAWVFWYWGEIKGSTVIWDKVFNLSQSKLRPFFLYVSRVLGCPRNLVNGCKWVITCYNLLINGVYWGYNPLINLLLTPCDIQVA